MGEKRLPLAMDRGVIEDGKPNPVDPPGSEIDRRQFVRIGLAAGAVLTSCADSADEPPADTPDPPEPRSVIEKTFTVARGDFEIPAAEGDTPRAWNLRSYNGQIPGPTLRARAGDQLRLRLVNDLPTLAEDERVAVYDPETGDGDPGDYPSTMNQPHGANTTNFHTHGFHVPPERPIPDEGDGVFSDNVLIAVYPEGGDPPPADWPESKRQNYFEKEVQHVYNIPQDHPPGTYWYHPHKHGSVSQQVANGMVGALIIDDEEGAMPEYIAQATEQVLILTAFDDSSNGIADDANNEPHYLVSRVTDDGTVEYLPKIAIAPGEVQRWRFLNATPNLFVSLAPGDDAQIEMYAIAVDGLTLPARQGVEPLSDRQTIDWNLDPYGLSPGNRVDFIVRAKADATPGTVDLKLYKHNNAIVPEIGINNLIYPDEAAGRGALVALEVAGDPVSAAWSEDASLPGPGPGLDDLASLPDDAIAQRRFVSFNVASYDGQTLEHRINGKLFTGEPMYQMKKGTVEEWTIFNFSTAMFHPVHIHVNPFYVTEIVNPKLRVAQKFLQEGTDYSDVDEEAFMAPRRRWHDTIAVPPAEVVRDEGTITDGNPEGNILVVPGSVTFRTHLKDFTGKFVIHCHILSHEDEGMMQVLEVID